MNCLLNSLQQQAWQSLMAKFRATDKAMTKHGVRYP
jgi:hypothetical protein